jgi:hypothetical protein
MKSSNRLSLKIPFSCEKFWAKLGSEKLITISPPCLGKRSFAASRADIPPLAPGAAFYP